MWENRIVDREVLDYYRTPGRFTVLDGIDFGSGDVREVVRVVQGLVVYDTVAQPFYGVELTAEQAAAIHERDSARLLALALAVDGRPIGEPRSPAGRVGGRCHAFS